MLFISIARYSPLMNSPFVLHCTHARFRCSGSIGFSQFTHTTILQVVTTVSFLAAPCNAVKLDLDTARSAAQHTANWHVTESELKSHDPKRQSPTAQHALWQVMAQPNTTSMHMPATDMCQTWHYECAAPVWARWRLWCSSMAATNGPTSSKQAPYWW